MTTQNNIYAKFKALRIIAESDKININDNISLLSFIKSHFLNLDDNIFYQNSDLFLKAFRENNLDENTMIGGNIIDNLKIEPNAFIDALENINKNKFDLLYPQIELNNDIDILKNKTNNIITLFGGSNDETDDYTLLNKKILDINIDIDLGSYDNINGNIYEMTEDGWVECKKTGIDNISQSILDLQNIPNIVDIYDKLKDISGNFDFILDHIKGMHPLLVIDVLNKLSFSKINYDGTKFYEPVYSWANKMSKIANDMKSNSIQEILKKEEIITYLLLLVYKINNNTNLINPNAVNMFNRRMSQEEFVNLEKMRNIVESDARTKVKIVQTGGADIYAPLYIKYKEIFNRHKQNIKNRLNKEEWDKIDKIINELYEIEKKINIVNTVLLDYEEMRTKYPGIFDDVKELNVNKIQNLLLDQKKYIDEFTKSKNVVEKTNNALLQFLAAARY